jgi:hypothetical protein
MNGELMISFDAGLSGFAQAQDRLDAAALRLAGGDVEPAVIAELLLARTQAAVAAEAIHTADEVTRHVIDILA